MSLQFVLGRANTKKREAMLDNVADILVQEPDAKIFYIVPEHMTFSMEMNVLDYLSKKPEFIERPLMGMIQLQVYSFSRLAWFFLQDSAVFNQTQLTDAGLAMLVRKLLQEWESELTIYRGESRHSGFIQRVTDMLLELRSGQVSIEDLDDMVRRFSDDPKTEDTALKLKDLTLLYQSFTQALFGKYIEREQIMDSLIDKIRHLDLSDTYFFIDSFHRFSAKEQTLLIEMMKRSKQVTVSLTLDKPYTQEKPDKLDLFYQTGETYFRLYQAAKAANIRLHFDQVIREPSKARCEELNQLEAYWVESSQANAVSRPSLSKEMDNCLYLWEAENKQAEVLHAANEIRKKTVSGEYRYKDILILARDIEEYRSILLPVFEENEIEVFVDEAESMANHPLVEALTSLLAIYRNHWRSHDVLRFLRTELFVPIKGKTFQDAEKRLEQLRESAKEFREKVDITENVVLAYGYEGSHWTSKDKWTFTTFELDEISEQTDEDKKIEAVANGLKKTIAGALEPFFKKLSKSKTNAQAARLLYQFLDKIGIDQQLLFWRDDAIARGDLDTARKQEQVWKNFIQLLDEYVDVLGEDEWNVEAFQTILETGFENATYSMVPPRIDQVILSNLTSAQPGTSKVVFMLGMTDQHLPAQTENHSVLTEEERALVGAQLEEGKYLHPLAEDLVATEPFIAYTAFMNASDSLYLSYPIKNDGNGDNKLSPYVQRIKEKMGLTLEYKPAEAISLAAFDLRKTDELLSFVGSPRTTLSQVLLVMRRAKEGNQPPSAFWLELFRYFYRHSQEDIVITRLLTSLDRRNIPKPLTPALAEQLYGKDLRLSISQLETFYLDPYSHFLRYGLKLRERPVQELTPAGTGSFFHEALDQIFSTLINENIPLRDLSEQKLEHVSDHVLNRLFTKDAYRILTVSNQMNFVRRQLAQTVRRMMWAMVNQSKKTNMSAAKTEVLFGQLGSQKGVPGLEYKLKDGGILRLRGKIDRIDVLESNGRLFLSVVDYKSSKHTIKFPDLYNGTALQMMTYLDTALSNSKLLFDHQAQPAGAFYSHVKNPFIKGKSEYEHEDIQREMIKQFKMDGLIVEDEELLKLLDTSISGSEHSIVYPYRLVKSGYSSSNFITKEELDVLQQYNRTLILQAGNQILAGSVDLKPYKEKKNQTPSINGTYNAISQFDVLLEENHYRPLLKDTSKQEILTLIQEALQKGDQTS